MRILFSTLGYPTKNHPFAAFIAMVAEEFAKLGNEVFVVAPQSFTRKLIRGVKSLPYKETIDVEGAKYPINIYRPKSFTVGEGLIRGKITIKSNKFAVKQCLKKLNIKFDIAYAHFWEAAYNVLSYTELHHIPLVIVTGEDRISLHKYLNSSQKERLNRKSYKVIGVSSKNIKESIDNGLALADSCVVIPNGPDLRIFHPYNKQIVRKELNIPQDCFLVAFTGRFIYRKGALRLEDAVLRLNDDTIKVIFIGSPMRDEDAGQEPFGKEILFKGIVEHNDLPKWLSAADLFVLPTLAEGCSNSIVEAMGCGLPIISSDLEFNYDVLDDRNSILIDPLDVDAISSAIALLKNDSQKRIEMGKASLLSADSISFEKRIDKILTILRQAVDENNRL